MSQQKKNHLICNAHLDPVWLWNWQEGLVEALSTFRVAVDLCTKYKTLIFNHNEAVLYKWVKEYDPELFSEIKRLVKLGRWHIMGGWFLQPDCNMPSGEAMIRQIQVGRSFFQKNFGVEPTTAINFDPFGHSRGIVQIIQKCGYDSYLFGRPQPKHLKLPAEDFYWLGYADSKVMACRFRGWYNTVLGCAAKQVAERLNIPTEHNCRLILWGVGNHGGGPSRKDIEDIELLIDNSSESIVHSTPESYFKELVDSKEEIPTYDGELNPWAVGSYISQVCIKQNYRKLENELFLTEKIVSDATSKELMRYPYEQFFEATEDLLFSQFHDILPGTSTEAVEQDSLQRIGHGLEILSKLKSKAFVFLSSLVGRSNKQAIPIYVYNPHPYSVSEIIEVEFNLPSMQPKDKPIYVNIFKEDAHIATQLEREDSNHPAQWRKKISFNAELLAGEMVCYDAELSYKMVGFESKIQEDEDYIKFDNSTFCLSINKKTGLIDSYKVENVEYVKPQAFSPIIMSDNEDPWGMKFDGFTKVVGHFKPISAKDNSLLTNCRSDYTKTVRVIEDGAVRSIVEVLLGYKESFIVMRYKLPACGSEFELDITVDWHQQSKVLKLDIPLVLNSPDFLAEDMFGVKKFAQIGVETVFQKWVAATDGNYMISCINEGTYAADNTLDSLRLTLLRSPAYTAHPENNDGDIFIPKDRYIPKIDQGSRSFKFWFNAGEKKIIYNNLSYTANIKNEKPIAMSVYGKKKNGQNKPLLVVDDKGVVVSAIKYADDNPKQIVIRLFEATGTSRSVNVKSLLYSCEIRLEMKPFEIRTIVLDIATTEFNDLEKIII